MPSTNSSQERIRASAQSNESPAKPWLHGWNSKDANRNTGRTFKANRKGRPARIWRGFQSSAFR